MYVSLDYTGLQSLCRVSQRKEILNNKNETVKGNYNAVSRLCVQYGWTMLLANVY